MRTAAEVVPTQGVKHHEILLVGQKTSWAKSVLKLIEESGVRPALIPPTSAIPECANTSGPALVLLDASVTSEQRKQIVAGLKGSGASLFYAYPVESGCWWLPAMVRGQDCHGSPAFRASEFPLELKKLLEGKEKRSIVMPEDRF